MTHIAQELVAIAPCLQDGPIAGAAVELVNAADALGDGPSAACIRAFCVPLLFAEMERVFATGDDPVPGIRAALTSLAGFVRASAAAGVDALKTVPRDEAAREAAAVASVTGEHYGQLFRAFSDTSYWDEPVRLLRDRLDRNGIDRSALSTQTVLDAGCGGGRYTVAWKLLGAKSVTGFDISETGLADARRRAEAAKIADVTFQQGSVLELPFAQDTFDVVYSNGVLHHTTDWARGVDELVRVLRPGGLGWLYLIENPGGLFWDLIEVLRVVTRDTPRDEARRALAALGLPANRIFYMLDHVMVPINVRLTPAQIASRLEAAGAKAIRRLERGTDFDRVEAIHRKDPHATVKYGVGENRFVFSK